MKRLNPYLIALIILLLITQACNLPALWKNTSSPTSQSDAETTFSGYAFLDTNGNRELDADDAPLERAIFTVAGFQSLTDGTGFAEITIPGEWTQPVTAAMSPPEDSDTMLIGPSEVILQRGKQTRADFLFSSWHVDALTPTPPGDQQVSKPARAGKMERDLTYCVASSGQELKMDIYYPIPLKDAAPAVVYVHGGGWISGDKSSGTGLYFMPLLRMQGYVIVSINYRLAPYFKFPAPIEDVKCAIRHLRAHARQYHIDPNRIGALGSSAGGHLVSLLATADESAGWDVGQYPEQSSRVQAVVNLFGPADLTQPIGDKDRNVIEVVFGASEPEDPLLVTFSPIAYISPDDPPFLILQGEKDTTVLPIQAQTLYEQLIAAGVPAELVLVKNAGHGFQAIGGLISPSYLKLQKIVANFFNQYLK